VFGITPSQDLTAAEVGVLFGCTNAPVSPSYPGVNTLILSASSISTPDMIAIGVTPSGQSPTGDGIVHVPGTTGTGFFTAAAVNIGAAGTITVTADDGGTGLPLNLLLCQTNPSTGACINPTSPGNSATFASATNDVATFSIFAIGTGDVVP